MIFNNIKINKSGKDQRVDNFLKKNIQIKENIYKIMNKNCILINKKKTSHNYKLKINDIININNIIKLKPNIIHIHTTFNTDIINNIIYENNNFIILNKPAGISVHDGTNTKYNIINILRLSNKFKNSYLELAHRLDKDTSGCLLIAKNKDFLKKINYLYQKQQIKKTYNALVKGHTKNILTIKIKQNIINSYNKKIKYNNTETITKIKTIKHFDHYSFIQIEPLTGKIHQIRIHMSYIGHPIIGDRKYGSLTYNKIISGFKTPKLYLHARSLQFICPISNKNIYVHAENNWHIKN